MEKLFLRPKSWLGSNALRCTLLPYQTQMEGCGVGGRRCYWHHMFSQ